MLEKIELFKVKKNNSVLYYEFDLGRFVKKIVLKSKADVSFNQQNILIKYAQNGITTDLIEAGSFTVDNDKEIVLSFEKAFPATHIYFYTDIDLNNYDIEIFEEMKETISNYYPCHFDTDLNENYYLDSVSVFTGKEGYSRYSVYTSIDGTNFDFLVKKTDKKPCGENGDLFFANGKEARIIRVFIEYNSSTSEAVFEKVCFTGKKSNTQIIMPKPVIIPPFSETEYNKPISVEDTYAEIKGIVERNIGKEYVSWFDFEICENPKNNSLDFFSLSFDGKVKIKGNNGVSVAVGLNHYLKYYCNVNISQVGSQTQMPDEPVRINGTVYRETKAKIRYAYNYCTHSYTMAFWGEKEWRKELDFLALNGVNLVLDITAQEEVWRRFLLNFGYSHKEIKNYIVGPAFYAWAYMANISHYCGPVHDSWFYQRTELARKNQRIMRTLGMTPILQGYSGMVPNDILSHDKDAEIILQGTWCSFDRPPMLKTTSKSFKKYAKLFYKAQKEVYGDISDYFATDPFHEGGNMGGMSAREVSSAVLGEMVSFNENAVWVIQSWMSNPSSELLLGLDDIGNGKNHALVLDLYAEKQPNYASGRKDNPDHGYSPEFDGTPWVFCMLNNFGGRCGIHGHIDNLNNNIPKAFNTCKFVAGIGITPESTYNNPVLYDFLFELVWKEDAIGNFNPVDMEKWIYDYTKRRYNFNSESVKKAWEILINTVYKAEFNYLGQGAVDSVTNSKPALSVKAASSWGSSSVGYDKKELVKAGKLLVKDIDALKDREGYVWDVIALLEQILVNSAKTAQIKMSDAFESGDKKEFEYFSDKFLYIFDLMDDLLSFNYHCTFAKWLDMVIRLTENTDDFTKMLYLLNAKAQITTWGPVEPCDTGGLRDYANKQWSGLQKNFYKKRWELWINERKKELSGEDFIESINWFEFEWEFATDEKVYEFITSDVDFKKLTYRILE